MKTISQWKIALKIISRNLFIISAFLIINIGVALLYNESLMPFVNTALITSMLALFFLWFSKGDLNDAEIQRKDGFVVVTLSWILICLLGSLPYLFSSAIPGYSDAVFESVSGFTTTGASILNDIESLPKSILFWRSLTHWIGGIGIIVLVIIIMPKIQGGGAQLFSNESSLQDKIKPKIRTVGIRLLYIYLSLTGLEIIFLLLGGMPLYDSICHAFGTIATGGFSTKNNSLVGYSPYIQYVVMIFMLLASTNFVIYYHLFHKEFKAIKRNEELRLYIKIVIFTGILIVGFLFFDSDRSLEASFRDGFFQLISIISTTGFVTDDYMRWPEHVWIILFLVMFIGGCTGSTSGGIKVSRYVILIKNIKRGMQQLVKANAVIPLKCNNEIVSDKSSISVLNFALIYFMFFLFSTVVLVTLNVDIKTAASSIATCMAGIGPGLEKVGPMENFAHFSFFIKLFLSFVMIVGRLEIYTVLILFTPTFWKS